MPGRIYLASKSPRRRELLGALGYEIVLLPQGVATPFAAPGDEERQPGEPALEYALRTAKTKAIDALAQIKAEGLERLPVVAADTTVVLGEEILGKPRDAAEELEFLEKLSGRTHLVRTAVFAGTAPENLVFAVSESKVTFERIAPEAMRAYAATAEPYDKAGGYAVQGLAAAFISRIEGSYSGIMGLPVYETAKLLSRFGRGVF